MKEGVRGTVKIGDAIAPLIFDPATGALSTRSIPSRKAAPTGPVMLDVTVGEKSFSLAFGG